MLVHWASRRTGRWRHPNTGLHRYIIWGCVLVERRARVVAGHEASARALQCSGSWELPARPGRGVPENLLSFWDHPLGWGPAAAASSMATRPALSQLRQDSPILFTLN